MKHPLIPTLGLAVLAGMSLVSPARAVVSIDWTTIGNPGNAGSGAHTWYHPAGYGAVSYVYKIGTYDVTNAQYVEFLNAKGASNSAGIYNSTMGHTGGSYNFGNIAQSGSSGSYKYSVSSTYANQPVVGVTWFDAARFCNWLQNGQGSGDMETGAYTLSGATSGFVLANADAQIRLPTQDEWQKAAFYNGATGTYSFYPDGRNDITPSDANYGYINMGLVNVNFGTPSSYGVYGMGGNAWQWNDVIVNESRGLYGGGWGDNGNGLPSSGEALVPPTLLSGDFSFRV